MLIRSAIVFLIMCVSAAAQDAPGSYILVLGKDKHPLAGSYRIGPGVKMVLMSQGGGLPRGAVYLDRAFFPTREAEILSFFYNARHVYSTDPLTVDVGSQVRIVDKETLFPPLSKDQNPDREKALKLTVSAKKAIEVDGQTLVGKVYKIDGDDPGDRDPRFGVHFHVETLDIVLPASQTGNIASIERGMALSSGDFQALYVERSNTTPDFVKCVAEKRKTPEYKALAERQKNTVDSLLSAGFTQGRVFWADTALYEANNAMSVYTLCPL